MITVKQQEKLVSRFETLSELELDAVVEDLVGVLEKNQMTHLIEKHTNSDELQDELYELEEKVDKLEEKVDDLEGDMREVLDLCESVDDTEEYDDGAFEELKGVIGKIKSISE